MPADPRRHVSFKPFPLSLPERKRIVPVFVVGKGNVGRAFLRQVAAARPALAARDVDLRVVGIAGRSSFLFLRAGIPDAVLRAAADGTARIEDHPRAEPHGGLADLAAALAARAMDGQTIVDVTAEDDADQHAAWLRAGWNVVTANKKPLTAPIDRYDAIMAERSRPWSPAYRFEATAGAGLPIFSTLRDMAATGDRIISVNGAVSGTLGFIFSACEDGARFADAVAEAKRLGYTEPDPRDDLAGTDVARKALIVARLMGSRLDLGDVAVESLVPDRVREDLDRRFLDAAARGRTLRYLASVSADGVRVGVEEVGRESPFGGLKGPENMFVIRTARYDAAPLVIRGPGAGAEVTAAGVFADLLRIFDT
jgi:homoserine dehydrogenase